MGLFEALIGVIVLGWVGSLFSSSSDNSSDDESGGYHNLHNAAERNHGIALNNCENCRWHGSNSCRWQENCYASPGKYHEHVCDNYEPKW